ncbi:MAG: FliG C-terminal domain-containing protein [Pirellulales bacterium]
MASKARSRAVASTSPAASHGRAAAGREAVIAPALRKAAILVSSLDGPLADALLARLSADEAAAIRRAAAEVHHVAPSEAESLVLEFRQVRPRATVGDGGDVVFESSRDTDLQVTSAEPNLPNDGAEAKERPFRFLSEADPRSLIPFLGKERPQTIAVVLSYLPTERAAEVLIALSTALQIDVMSRLADLDTTDDESLRVVENEIRQWMDAQRDQQRQRKNGLGAVSGILAAARSSDRQRLLENLRSTNHVLADRIATETTRTEPESTAADIEQTAPLSSQRPVAHFDFDDLLHLDAAELATLVANTEPELVILALAGASEPLVRHVLQGIPTDTAASLKKGLTRIGPIRLSDVEAAQRAIAELAGQLHGADRVTSKPRLTVAV